MQGLWDNFSSLVLVTFVYFIFSKAKVLWLLTKMCWMGPELVQILKQT